MGRVVLASARTATRPSVARSVATAGEVERVCRATLRALGMWCVYTV